MSTTARPVRALLAHLALTLWLGVPLALSTVPEAALVLTGAVLWRGVAVFLPSFQPPPLLVGAAGLGLIFFLLPQHGLTVEGAFGFLLIATAGKVLEWRHEGEARLLWGLLWYLLAGRFLFETSLLTAFHAFVGVLALLAVRFELRLKGQLIALTGATLFLGALFFLLLPRPGRPLWSLPLTESYTGLSGRLAPGSVARLSASRELAFRVEFLDRKPDKPYYFRAQIFWFFDGQAWWPGPKGSVPPASSTRSDSMPITSRLMVEPHRQRWLFVLGLPLEAPPHSRHLLGGLLESDKPILTRQLFELKVLPTDRIPLFSKEEILWGLQLPKPPSPRVRRLVAELREKSGGEIHRLIAATLAFFQKNGFRYTTEPRPIRGDFIEGFLFETREGFCEHFASAFAFLLRAAGVPARVVGGYLGGVESRLGDFLEVYQSNAHAWVEVWDGNAWRRVDPTSVVAPDDLETLEVAPDLRPEQKRAGQPRAASKLSWLLWRIKSLWSLADYRWQLLLVQFDQERQLLLWRKLRTHVLPLISLLVALVVLSWWGLSLWRRWRDPVGYWFARFERKVGLRRRPNETVSDFCRRAAERLPEKAEEIEQIGQSYLELRYGRQGALKELARRIQAL